MLREAGVKTAWIVAGVVLVGLLLLAVMSWVISLLVRILTFLFIVGVVGLAVFTLGWLIFGRGGKR